MLIPLMQSQIKQKQFLDLYSKLFHWFVYELGKELNSIVMNFVFRGIAEINGELELLAALEQMQQNAKQKINYLELIQLARLYNFAEFEV